jgi:predicted acylesterase/phospholipase RssA
MEIYPTVMILGPGGMKGMLQLGSLYHIEELGILKNITTMCGVSVGAVIALLLICGYTVTEIISESMEVHHLFQDISSLNFSDIKNNSGLIDQISIKNKLTGIVKKKFGFVPDMEHLYMITGIKFETVSMNLSKDCAVYLSHETEPDLSVVDAVLMSINIPFLFYKIKYKNDLYIDGAFGNPYPINRYDNGETCIIGIYISTHISDTHYDSPFIYFYKIMVSSINQMLKMIIANCSERCMNIELTTSTYDMTGLTLKNDDRVEMFIEGYKVCQTYMNKKKIEFLQL